MAGGRIVGSAYRIPQLPFGTLCVQYHAGSCLSRCRAAEACYVMERVMSVRLGKADAVTLRKTNFISAEEMPSPCPLV